MNIEKALELFNIKSLSDLTEELIKKQYRKLMIKYHPDNNNGDITKSQDLNVAKDILLDALKSISKTIKSYSMNNTNTEEIIRVVLTYSQVEKLYNGGKIEITRGTDTKELKMIDLVRNEIYILFNYKVKYNGIEESHSAVLRADNNSTRKYNLECNVYTSDFKPVEVEVEFENITRKYEVNRALIIPFVMKSGALISIQVNNKIKVVKVEE